MNKQTNTNTDNRKFLDELKRLGNLWPYLKPQKKYIYAAVFFIPIIAGLQSITPIIIKFAIDDAIVPVIQNKLPQAEGMHQLWMFGSVYIGIILVEYLARVGHTMTAAYAVHQMIRRLRNKIISHVLKLKASFHDKSMSGSLVTRATSDFDSLSDSLNMGVLNSVVDISVLVGIVSGMLWLNWRLALCAIVILPIVALIVRQFSVALKRAMMKARRKIATLNAYTQECLYGNSTIKLLASEEQSAKHYDKLNKEYRDAQMSSVILDASMFSVIDGIAYITLGVLALWLAWSWGALSEEMSAGVLIAFVAYIQQLFEPLKQLGNKMALLQGAFTAIDRIFGVLEQEEFVDGDQVPSKLKGDVKFENVRFAYDKNDQQILKDISFSIKAGNSLAIVGATGSGKSTIIKLATKLYDGYSGQIYLDNYELRNLSPVDLRKQIAIVPQDIVMFDGTLAFNIGLGIETDIEKIKSSATSVGADEFIKKLPDGYDFRIKEQGSNLSQGQRQLIAFARAIVKDPALVILDEATSSIDPESEAIIQEAIGRILKDRSVIVIAHRLSTIKQCDDILVLDKGTALEIGSHNDLVAAKGPYFNLLNALA